MGYQFTVIGNEFKTSKTKRYVYHFINLVKREASSKQARLRVRLYDTSGNTIHRSKQARLRGIYWGLYNIIAFKTSKTKRRPRLPYIYIIIFIVQNKQD